MAINSTDNSNRVGQHPSAGDTAPRPSSSSGSGLTIQNLRGMLMNEPVGIVVISSRGWIIATIIAIAKFMAKLTGSQLVIHNLDNAPLQPGLRVA